MAEDEFFTKTLWQLLFTRGIRRFSVPVFSGELAVAVLCCISPLIQKTLIESASQRLVERTYLSAIFLIFVFAGIHGCRAAARKMRGKLSIHLKTDLRSAALHFLMMISENDYRNHGSGYFFNRVQNDSNETASFLSGTGILFWTETLKILLALVILYFYQWQIFLLILPFLVLQMFICIHFKRTQYNLSHRIHECAARERHAEQDILLNHTTIKTHSIGHNARMRLEPGIKRWRNLMLQRLSNENRFLLCLHVPVWLCCGSAGLWGLHQVLRGQWSLGGLWAVLGLLMTVLTPARSLGGAYVQMQSARAAWARLKDLARSADTKKHNAVTSPGRLDGDIAFHNVYFGYCQNIFVLRNFNFTVASGEIVWITGENGCGKSTLLGLLLRLYEPWKGSIRIGEKSICNLELDAYRSQIAYISQTPEFIKGTVRDNLLLGEERSDKEIVNCFRSLGCMALLESLPDGLCTAVSERGLNFSGGERLRLALIRELLRNTTILLLDEPTANLDEEGRLQFYTLLDRLHGIKTVLVVAHEIPPDSPWPCLRLDKIH